MAWFIQKIINQLLKIKRYFANRKIARFKRRFKSCGTGFFVKFPVVIEGQENVTVGNNVKISPFVHMWGNGKISIGNDCLIASHVAITSLTHDTEGKLYSDHIVIKEVIIGANVWIGAHAVILPGITIGDNAIIGSCAMVNKDVPANAVVAGVPAKIIRYAK